MGTLRIFTTETVADIDPRLYGSFVEHLGRCVYTGIYEPGHPRADAEGWRMDTLSLARDLGISIVRYPGGNFVSNYRWEDGIGPRELRPRRLDLAWRATETNEVGTDEFASWCKMAGAAPMMAVNLGTRGIDAAVALLEYCNHPGGSTWSDLRRKNGHAEPHQIRTWCLGNELDGTWQIGNKTATEYGQLAGQTARAMRKFDRTLEIVAVGSTSPKLPTFLHWEQEVLTHCYDAVDAISLHNYLGHSGLSMADYLASPVTMDRQIRAVVTACDFIRARDRHRKEMMLSFDEWNVWDMVTTPGIARDHASWSEAPRQIEQIYSSIDALVFAGMLLNLLRHAKRVRMACVSQLVNVLGVIMTEPGGPAWRQSTYWPFMHCSRHGRGHLLETTLEGGHFHESSEYGPVPFIDAVATRNGDNIAVFVLNRGTEEARFDIKFEGGEWIVQGHDELVATLPEKSNSLHEPDAVGAHTAPASRVDRGNLELVLPPLSWHCVRLAAK